MTLTSKAVHAVKWNAAGAVVRASIQYAQLAVLTRLLTPSDFGLMAVVSAITAYGAIFAEAGMSSGLIQRAAADNVVRSTVFWASVLIACCSAGLLVATAPLLAHLFHSDHFRESILICAPSLVISAVGRQFEVDAERALAFRGLVVIDALSNGFGAVVAVTLAYREHGAVAIAWGILASSGARCMLNWICIARAWTPRACFNRRAAQPYVNFGSLVLAGNLVNQVNSSIDVLLGGRLLGMNTAGLYSVPRQLILSVQGLVNPIVTRVGFPLIARSQHDGEQTSIVYRRMVNAIALTNAPIYSAIAVLHIDICALLLGPGWADSAGLLIPLSAWGYLRSLQNPVGALLLGLGRAKRALAWNCALLVFYPVALVIGSKFGVIGLASSLLVTALILLVPGWRWLVQPFTGWELRGYLATTILPLLIAIGCCLAAKILTQQMANVPLRIGMTLLVAGMGYLLAVPFISPVAGQLARSCIHFRR